MKRLSLAGTWEFRPDEAAPWRPIAVPGCWETLGIRKDFPGPVWYRMQVRVPKAFAGKRVWLRFEGVSYHCTVTVNGWEAGCHTGIWDGFRLEITSAILPGETAEVGVKVEKPASLKQGPAFEAHPAWGDFPHEGWVNLQFYGLATDFALDTEQTEHAQPILRRLDARTMRLHEYATALHRGEGRAIVSTLRFAGGLGDQPSGIRRNPAVAYLLSCWIRHLQLE